MASIAARRFRSRKYLGSSPRVLFSPSDLIVFSDQYLKGGALLATDISISLLCVVFAPFSNTILRRKVAGILSVLLLNT